MSDADHSTAVPVQGLAFVGCTLSAVAAVVGWWLITVLTTGRLVIVLTVGLALPAAS